MSPMQTSSNLSPYAYIKNFIRLLFCCVPSNLRNVCPQYFFRRKCISHLGRLFWERKNWNIQTAHTIFTGSYKEANSRSSTKPICFLQKVWLPSVSVRLPGCLVRLTCPAPRVNKTCCRKLGSLGQSEVAEKLLILKKVIFWIHQILAIFSCTFEP